jgi:uncharacterized membrane protein
MRCLLERTHNFFAKVLISVTEGFYMHAINQKSGVGRFFTYLIEYSISSIYISLMTTDITMQYAPMLYSDHSCVAMTIFELSNVDLWQRGFYRAYHKSQVTQEGVEAPASTGAKPETLPSQGPSRVPILEHFRGLPQPP